MNKVFVKAGTACAALLLAAVSLAPPAQASTRRPTVVFHAAATVRADGAGAVVVLDVACTGVRVDYLEVDVEQRQPGGRLATAAGYAILTSCGPSAQRVTSPLQTGVVTEDAGFPVNDIPLRPGPAQADAFYYCDSTGTCDEHYYHHQPVTLAASGGLDHAGSAAGRLASVGRLVDGGRAADLRVRATCAPGTAGGWAGQNSLTQTGPAGTVGYASPATDPGPDCAAGAPVWYRVRVAAADGRLVPGPAFLLYGPLWGVVTLRR